MRPLSIIVYARPDRVRESAEHVRGRVMQYASHLCERFRLRDVVDASETDTRLPTRGALIIANDEAHADSLAQAGGSFGQYPRVMALDEALDEVGRPDPDPAQVALLTPTTTVECGGCAPPVIAGGFLTEPTPCPSCGGFCGDTGETCAERDAAVRAMATSAPGILRAAAQHLQDRAALRDQPAGERSMARTVSAFNALTGHAISERDGWLFMVALKAARACTTPTGIADDYQDGSAYFALAGESAGRAA